MLIEQKLKTVYSVYTYIITIIIIEDRFRSAV